MSLSDLLPVVNDRASGGIVLLGWIFTGSQLFGMMGLLAVPHRRYSYL